MLHFSRIEKTLRFLDSEYNRHIVSRERERPAMYSKLGVLELSGWIEESFDEIARNGVRDKLRLLRSRDVLEKKILRTHGFSYKEHSRELLAVALGSVRLLSIEKELKRNGSLLQLTSELGALNKQRKMAAHTYVKGTTLTFDAPSVTLARYYKIKPVLQKLWTNARST